MWWKAAVTLKLYVSSSLHFGAKPILKLLFSAYSHWWCNCSNTYDKSQRRCYLGVATNMKTWRIYKKKNLHAFVQIQVVQIHCGSWLPIKQCKHSFTLFFCRHFWVNFQGTGFCSRWKMMNTLCRLSYCTGLYFFSSYCFFNRFPQGKLSCMFFISALPCHLPLMTVIIIIRLPKSSMMTWIRCAQAKSHGKHAGQCALRAGVGKFCSYQVSKKGQKEKIKELK